MQQGTDRLGVEVDDAGRREQLVQPENVFMRGAFHLEQFDDVLDVSLVDLCLDWPGLVVVSHIPHQ